MNIEECQHCLSKVIFTDKSICPNCGKSKNLSPEKNRSSIEKDQEIENLEFKISYYSKTWIYYLLGGLALFLVASAISILTTLNGNFVFWWYGGVLVGSVTMWKGWRLRTEGNRLKRQLQQYSGN